MDLRLVYITVKNIREAKLIGRALVEEHLAACANIVPRMTSIYRWKNTLREENETVLLLKTRAALMRRLTKRVKELHSYDVPCIVSMQMKEGNAAYLKWIEEETTH